MIATVLAALLAVQADDRLRLPTHRHPADKSGVLELQTRDLRPLTRRLSELRGHRFGVGADVIPDAAYRPSRLTEIARAFVQPPLGKGEDVRDLADAFLIAVARPEQQAWIDRFLHAQPELAIVSIQLQLTLLRVDAETWKEHGFGESKILAARDGAKLLGRLGGRFATPMITVLPYARGMVSMTNQVAYIKDVRSVIGPDGRAVADPVVDILQTGTVCEIRAARLGEDSIGVLGKLTLVDAATPFPTKTLKTAAGPAEIQVPAVTTQTLDVEVAVRSGQYGFVSGEPTQGQRPVVVVRYR